MQENVIMETEQIPQNRTQQSIKLEMPENVRDEMDLFFKKADYVETQNEITVEQAL